MTCEETRKNIPELLAAGLPAARRRPAQGTPEFLLLLLAGMAGAAGNLDPPGHPARRAAGPGPAPQFLPGARRRPEGPRRRQRLAAKTHPPPARLAPRGAGPAPGRRLPGRGRRLRHRLFRGRRGDGGKIERLGQEVDRLQQQMTLQLLDQPSASARLQGISLTSRVQDPAPALIAALLDTLDNDPSVNVRLSAVDALYLFCGPRGSADGPHRLAFPADVAPGADRPDRPAGLPEGKAGRGGPEKTAGRQTDHARGRAAGPVGHQPDHLAHAWLKINFSPSRL